MRALLFCLLTLGSKIFASGFLTVETTPAGVEVWASKTGEGKMNYLGDSPLDARELTAGAYDLWLIQNKDSVAVKGVSIVDGQHSRIAKEMPANYALLKVQTEPDSGEIWLDGVMLGNSPYVNNLVFPGIYALKQVPRAFQFRTRKEKLTVRKGDSLDFHRTFSFRDKSFLEENLSIRPWALQLEWGYQFISQASVFDSSGERKSLQDSAARTQNDFPATLRFGFPFGLEAHAQLPFHSYDDHGMGAPVPRDFSVGMKYTHRPLGAGFDASYSFGSDTSGGGLNHNRLILTAIGMHSRKKVLVLGNAGFALHFADKDSSNLNPGNVLFANVRIGYAAGPILPYLGARAEFILEGEKGDSSTAGGRLIALEPGLVFDLADVFSFQAAVPFALFGKNSASHWGIQASMAIRFGVID